MSAQIVVNGAQGLHHLRLLRLRQDHTSVSPHAEAEEVKALVDVGDPGLRLAQLQPSLTQEGRELGDDIRFADQADAVVGTTAKARSDVSTSLVLGSEEPFH